MNPILIGGHRGSGCTDSKHALARERTRSWPPENTLESFQRAFDEGADFVELDVVRTADDALVVIHSNELSDHVADPGPGRFVGELTQDALLKLRTGLGVKRGEIPTLASVLDLAVPRRRPGKVVLNIEIKDVKGTDAPKRGNPSLVELLAEQLKHHPLPLEAVVFSSFAVSDLVGLAAKLPGARLGMLFDEAGSADQRVYPGSPELDDRYLLFTPTNVRNVAERIHAVGNGARLEFAHPELRTLSAEAVEEARRHGLGLFCWVMKEPVPAPEDLRNAVELARKHGVSLGFITDFVPELRSVLKQLQA